MRLNAEERYINTLTETHTQRERVNLKRSALSEKLLRQKEHVERHHVPPKNAAQKLAYAFWHVKNAKEVKPEWM